MDYREYLNTQIRIPRNIRTRAIESFRSPRNVAFIHACLQKAGVCTDKLSDRMEQFHVDDVLANNGIPRISQNKDSDVTMINPAFIDYARSFGADRQRAYGNRHDWLEGGRNVRGIDSGDNINSYDAKLGGDDPTEDLSYRLFAREQLNYGGLNDGALWDIRENNCERDAIRTGTVRSGNSHTSTCYDWGDYSATDFGALDSYNDSVLDECTAGRYERKPCIPFYQNLSSRNLDKNIEETLGYATREHDCQVRRWAIPSQRYSGSAINNVGNPPVH